MAQTPTLRSRLAEAALAFIDPEGAQHKDGGGAIWGDAFTTFMGISGTSGGAPLITDNQSSYATARTAESYVFTCEQVRARAISQVPLRCYEVDADGKKHSIEHDALEVLEDTNPFGYVDGLPALDRMTLTSLDTHGRSAWKLAFNRRGEPSEIYWQIPTQFSPIPDPKTFIRGIRVRDDDGVREIPYGEVCYFSSDNPLDPLLGTSRIAVLKNPINLRSYSQYNNIDFFRNSMRPDWMLSGSFANTEDNIARIRRGIRRMLSGANNRAPLILGEGMTAHLLTTSHEDAQWVEQQRLAQEEISSVFGVPLIYLNNLERATYENIRVAKALLWHDTMIPDCDDLADRYTRRFLRQFWADAKRRRYVLAFDYTEIQGLGEDIALIWERVVALSKQLTEQVKNRELTPHQARAIRQQLFADLGLDTTPFEGQIAGGDTFFEQFSYVPVDQLSVQAAMNITGMRGQNPEFIEDVPGAPTAGDNAEQVVARLNKPPEPPTLPSGPPPPALPPGPSEPPSPEPPTPPPSAPDQPAKEEIVDVAALKRQVAAELREEVQRTVGEAAVQAFGQALERYRQPVEPTTPDPQLERRLKRYFQDQQTDSLRTLRQAQAAGVEPPVDLWSRRVYEDRLAELVGGGRAREVEAATRAALRRAGPSGVAAVFRDAIDRRAGAIAAGKADPTADEPPSDRPLGEQARAAEEHYASGVLWALRGSFDVDQAAFGWLALSGERKAGGALVSADLLTAARQFAAGLGLDLSGVAAVIRAIYQDGWRLGIGVALKVLAGRGLPAESSDEAADIDWSTWKPGSPAAAQQAARLADLLQQADVVIRGISDTTLGDIAEALAEGAASGDSVEGIAEALRGVLGDEDRAAVIAHTELARAQSAASLETYRFNGVQGKGWLTYQPCPVCRQNEGVVVPLDGPFPSGDQMPPAHPRCRCSLVPEALDRPAVASVESSRPVAERKEILYATDRRAPEHDHSTDAGERPVIVLDLHGTITPSDGFTAPGLPGAMLPPFEGVKAALDALVAGGCCLHIATAALSPVHPPDVVAARRRLVDGYITEYGLPVAWITGKIAAHVYYDDRAVSARGRSWADILAEVVERLNKRFDLGADGVWRRKDIPETGRDYERPRPEDIAADQPRGLSTRVIDIDLHRCLFAASSSKLVGPLKPGALEAVRAIYDAGCTVHLSCAGWDPTTHDPADSAQRLAAMRQQVRALGVPYDEMVSKDHPDLGIDDKSIRHTDWKADLPLLLAALATPHPEDEVTQHEPDDRP